jgi:hypothetical protein
MAEREAEPAGIADAGTGGMSGPKTTLSRVAATSAPTCFQISAAPNFKARTATGNPLPGAEGGDDNEILGNEILGACRCDRRAGRGLRCFCQQPSPRHDGLRRRMRVSLGDARPGRAALWFARSFSFTK